MDKVYIVRDGEFELLRVRKGQYKLIDPINYGLLTGLEDEQIPKFIGPRILNFKPHKRYESVKLKNGARGNNSLFRGQRGLAGELCINIIGPGQLIGWDDVSRERISTKGMRCLSIKGTVLTLPSSTFLRMYHNNNEFNSQIKNMTLRRDVQTLGKIIKTKSAIKKLMRPSGG